MSNVISIDPTIEQDIIQCLATKIMGWRNNQMGYWVTNEGRIQVRISEWNPLRNIAHAWMIVERIRNNEEYETEFNLNMNALFGNSHNRYTSITPMTISTAAYLLIADADD